jgi:vancomycin resistance protein YoaR
VTFSKKFPFTILIIAISALFVELFFLIDQTGNLNKVETVSKSDFQLSQGKLLNAVKNDFSLMDDAQNLSYAIKPADLRSWLASSSRDYFGQQQYGVDEEKVKEYLISMPITIATQPADGQLAMDDSNNLIETVKSEKGLVLNVDATVSNIISSLKDGRDWAEIKFDGLEPKISLEKAKELGVTALLAKGESNFSNSSSARVHNISVGAAIYNGYVIKPGEEFSFNNILGTVDASTGYKPELVIKNKTVTPEYGGGLCQVSTTMFRAAVNSGLPITERHAHSFPVSHYNPQGFDATIYPGVSDLRFVNDTQGNILIQSEIHGTSLSFDFFGASDGRKVVVDGPHILTWDKSGAMTTILYRHITYSDGMDKKDSFYSDYKSPALFPTVQNPLD